MERGYRSLGYVLMGLVPIFIAGFWIPYISEFPHFDPSISTAVHIHAVLLFSFLGLLVIQPLAIRHRSLWLHRMLGKLANVLMPFILLFSATMLWKEYREHIVTGASAALARKEEFLSAAQLMLLGIFYWQAILSVRKRNVAGHMRYMICIALVLMPAGLARRLGYWFNFPQSSSQTLCLAVIDLLLIGLIVFDRYRSKVSFRPYAVALSAYLSIETIWFLLGQPV